jgi:hypothetical protein
MYPWRFACRNVFDFLPKSPWRESITTTSYNILFPNVKSWNFKRKFKERKDLTGAAEVQSAIQEMTS